MKLSIKISYIARARLQKKTAFSPDLIFTFYSRFSMQIITEIISTEMNATELCFLLMKINASDLSELGNTTHTFIYCVE